MIVAIFRLYYSSWDEDLCIEWYSDLKATSLEFFVYEQNTTIKMVRLFWWDLFKIRHHVTTCIL